MMYNIFAMWYVLGVWVDTLNVVARVLYVDIR